MFERLHCLLLLLKSLKTADTKKVKRRFLNKKGFHNKLVQS